MSANYEERYREYFKYYLNDAWQIVESATGKIDRELTRHFHEVDLPLINAEIEAAFARTEK